MKNTTFEPMRVAVIGCGHISDVYFKTMIEKFQILDVVGCCDLDRNKAKEKAEKYKIKAMTIDEIMADENIEMVVNLTAPPAHYEVIKKMLEAGKHVYTEKVLTVHLEEAAELVSIAQEKNLYLGAAPDTILGSAIQTARYVVDSGMIGDVTSCYCVLNRDSHFLAELFPFCSEPGGGIGFDVGIYYVTALLNLLGPVREVSGVSLTRDKFRKRTQIETLGEPYTMMCETLLAGTLQFENGAVGSMHFDSSTIMQLPEKPSMVLFGTMGIMKMADPVHYGGDVKVMLKGNTEYFSMQQSYSFNSESRGLGVAEMAWSIRKGRKNRLSKEMAYHALEVIHGIVRSGETKQNYTLQSTFEIPPAIPRGYINDSETSIAL